MSLRKTTCFLCLVPDAMEIRFDRKGKPFLRCCACGSRTFMSSVLCWKGLALMRPMIEALLQQMEDPAVHHQAMFEVESFKRSLIAEFNSTNEAPATQAPAVPAQQKVAA